MEILRSPALGPLSASAILALVVIWILRGYLVPRRTVTEFLRVKDERLDDAIKRGDEYKATAENYRAALATRDAQLSELLEYARTADQVLRSLREVAK